MHQRFENAHALAVPSGCMLYQLIPNMPQHRLLPLMRRFAEMLISSGLFGGFLSGGGMDEGHPASFDNVARA
jgi:hypothetical protein